MAILYALLAVFVLATLFQLAAWWFIFRKLAFPPPPAPHQQSSILDPQSSILLCARNEAANLRRHLPAVLEQDYPDFEVIVIDDASDDDTPAVLAFFQEKYPHLRVLRLPEKTAPGKKQALATGVAAARHELLVLTDADCRPAGPHWLKGLLRHFGDPAVEIVLGYGPLSAEKGFFNAWLRYETVFTAVQYLSFARAGMPYMGVGRNLAWRKGLFARTGGFAAHADLASGDDDLFVNAAARPGNTAVCLDPATFVFSEGKKNGPAWLRQKRRHLSAGPRYRGVHKMALGALAVSHVLHFGAAVVLLLAGFGMKYVLPGCFLREGSILFLHSFILPRLGERRLLPLVALFDVLMAGYYAFFVPFVLVQKKESSPWT